MGGRYGKRDAERVGESTGSGGGGRICKKSDGERAASQREMEELEKVQVEKEKLRASGGGRDRYVL